MGVMNTEAELQGALLSPLGALYPTVGFGFRSMSSPCLSFPIGLLSQLSKPCDCHGSCWALKAAQGHGWESKKGALPLSAFQPAFLRALGTPQTGKLRAGRCLHPAQTLQEKNTGSDPLAASPAFSQPGCCSNTSIPLGTNPSKTSVTRVPKLSPDWGPG